MDVLDEDIRKYLDEWTRTMIEIWREEIERLGIVRSGALHQSFRSHIAAAAAGQVISMKFAKYGIYQELGVGYGYVADNGGDLEFLDKDYRKEHGLDKPRKVGPAWGGYMTSGKPREKRVWNSRKLYASTMAMVEDLARITGDDCARVICDALSDLRNT